MPIFLKLEGIEGEIKGEIQVESFSWGVQNPHSIGSGTGAGGGRPSFQDFTFTSRLGRQSPQLFMAAVTGNSVGRASLAIDEPPQQLLISFSNVFISSYKEDVGLSNSQDRPVESVSFNFESVEIQVNGAHLKA